jgi:pimeloyl-ACP methyl ester carboxylesterase
MFYGLITGAAPKVVGPLEPGHEIVTLDTRSGITMRILLAMPNAAPKGTFIFFPGGSGQLVGEDGQVRQGFSGQQGTGLFAEQGFVAVLVDWPSDQAQGGSDQFRISQAHTEDTKRLIDFVSQKWPKPIFLIGHSLGTISVAHLAAVLKDDRISGVVLMGSDGGDRRKGPRIVSLSSLPLQNITYPVLFVHHREDGCFGLHAVRQQHNRIVNSRRLGFIEVLGGDAPQGDPCRGGKNLHTFMGREREVVKAIVDWATGKPVPERIGQ